MSTTAKKKSKKAKTERKDVLENWEFDPNKAKVLISIRLDGDVLEAVKAAANERGMKYQPFINEVLRRQFVFGELSGRDLAEFEEAMRKIAREEIERKAG